MKHLEQLGFSTRSQAKSGSVTLIQRFGGSINRNVHSMVVPKPKAVQTPDTVEDDKPSSSRMSWARLLKRVFNIDVETCHLCAGPMKVIAAIEDPQVISKILSHLGLPIKPPEPWPARGPPAVDEFELQQYFEF